MSIRLSEVGEYSQQVATRRPAVEVATSAAPPMMAAQEALSRRGNGLAITEVGATRQRLNGLGELVQVVT